MDNIERKKAQQRSNHVLYAKLLIWTGFTFGVVSVPWDTSGNRISLLAFLTQTFSKGKGNIILIEMIYCAYSNNSGRYHSAIFVHCQLLYNDGLMKIVCKEQFRGRIAQFTVYSWDSGGKMHGWIILAVACHAHAPSDILSIYKQVQAANK